MPDWLAAWAAARGGKKPAGDGEEGDDEDQLEEVRRWKAKLARMEFLERRRLLIRSDHAVDSLTRFATMVRDAVDRIEHEPDRVVMQRVLRDNLARVENEVETPRDVDDEEAAAREEDEEDFLAELESEAADARPAADNTNA